MTSGPIVALALCKVDAIKAWRQMMGPTDSAKARKEASTSLRALHGTDNTMNACHGSDSPLSAARELNFHFPKLTLDAWFRLPADGRLPSSSLRFWHQPPC